MKVKPFIMSSYKRNRSRKTWDVQTLRLRLQDAIKSIEPVFLGKPGEDYDKEDMQMKLKAAHAFAQLAGKAQKLAEIDELEKRISELERKTNMRKVS